MVVEACSDFPDIAAYLREVALNRITVLRQFDASADIDATIDEAYVDGRAAKESEIPNFKGSYLGRFSLVSADSGTSDHLSERS